MSGTWNASSAGQPSQPTPKRPLAVIGMLVLVVTVAAGALWYFVSDGGNTGSAAPSPGATVAATDTPSPLPAAPTDSIAKFSGTGDETTETFDVEGTWYITWRNQGDKFELTVTGDHDLGTVASQDEPGSGGVQSMQPGTYRLEIAAEGRWTVQILQRVAEDERG